MGFMIYYGLKEHLSIVVYSIHRGNFFILKDILNFIFFHIRLVVSNDKDTLKYIFFASFVKLFHNFNRFKKRGVDGSYEKSSKKVYEECR